MHDAVELLMIALLDHLQAPANKKREFLDFWPDMKKAGHDEPPDYIAMDRLNSPWCNGPDFGMAVFVA